MTSEAQRATGCGAAGGFPAPAHRNSPVLLALAWAVVAIPAAWGISMTAKTSVQLFKPTAPATTHAAPVVPAPQR